MNNQTAFGGIFQQLVELTLIVLRSEPLDDEIERCCKHACEQAPFPDCGETDISAGDSSPCPRLWCSKCRYTFTYTRNTPFEGRTLTSGEVIIAFVLYADTLLSINQVAQFFEAVYDTVYTTIREVEAAFESSFHLVWTHLQEDGDSPTQIDEIGQKCSGFKGQTPPRDGLSRGGDGEPGRSRWEGSPGDTMTLVGACRDTLRVVRAERGAKPDELRQTLDEVEILSGKIDKLWHDGWRGYAPLFSDNEEVVPYSEEFVTDEGVHVNQVECLWSLVNPWPQKFRGLSRVPLSGLIDCFAVNILYSVMQEL